MENCLEHIQLSIPGTENIIYASGTVIAVVEGHILVASRASVPVGQGPALTNFSLTVYLDLPTYGNTVDDNERIWPGNVVRSTFWWISHAIAW